MKSKTVVLTAAAGRKLLRRIRSLEDQIHALEALYEVLKAAWDSRGHSDFDEDE